MVFKHFRVNVVVRILTLSCTYLFFFYLTFHTKLFATTIAVFLFSIYQTYGLIRYVERTNLDLSQFLRSIKYADFSQTFSTGRKGQSFDELKSAYTEVVHEFQKARAEKEEHFQYLQTIVQHIGVGLLSFKPDGEVGLINTAAKRLLKISNLRNLRSLEPLNKVLVETFLQLKPGEQSLVKTNVHDEPMHLALHATEFKLRNQQYILVSIQDIRAELEEKEMEAWQNLIRVLTHEIMNSITPISSLASTLSDLLNKPTSMTSQMSREDLGDIRGAIHTIERRSQGLLHFVETYQHLVRIPRPNFKIFLITELFERIEKLMRSGISGTQIILHTNVEPNGLELTADPEQVEQVLINLLLNAIQALQGQADGKIDLTARVNERGRIIIQVEDNGPGVTEEAQKKIFVPFFTTKPHGSGIGLSLSRQIMRLHKGDIYLESKLNEKTVFTLRF